MRVHFPIHSTFTSEYQYMILWKSLKSFEIFIHLSFYSLNIWIGHTVIWMAVTYDLNVPEFWPRNKWPEIMPQKLKCNNFYDFQMPLAYVLLHLMRVVVLISIAVSWPCERKNKVFKSTITLMPVRVKSNMSIHYIFHVMK